MEELEALKARESDLIRELEFKNSEKNTYLQKHRQVLLNAAHFLRLYHKSSKDAFDILNSQTITVEESEIPQSNSDESINSLLSVHSIRLLWDALDNSEYLRAIMILKYLKNGNFVFEDQKKSFEYFESQLFERILDFVTEDNLETELMSTALIALSTLPIESILENIITKFSSDYVVGAHKIINLYKNFTLIAPFPKDEINLFTESDSSFCEFPELKDLKGNVPEFNEATSIISILKIKINAFINETLKSRIEETVKMFSNDSSVLEQLELEEELYKSITNKLKEIKLNGNSEKFKADLAEFFDKLMKTIQTSIRTQNYTIDEALIDKFHICSVDSSELDGMEGVFETISQTITNKSNIIFTIHRNELAALNSKQSVPIGSRLYSAVKICNKLFKLSNSNPTSFLNDFITQKIIIKFMDSWFNDISAMFTKLKNENHELYALIWLSNHILSLQVTDDDSSKLFDHLKLDLNHIKEKYLSQAALLYGLFETENISTPKLSPTIPNETTKELLPHFIPQ